MFFTNKNTNDKQKLPFFFIGLAVFLLVWLARIIVIKIFAVDVPFQDCWEGEIANLYLPYLKNQLSLKLLFAAHNEHIIFFTKTFNLIIFIIRGYYNPVLVMIMQSMIWALTASLLAVWSIKDQNRINYYSLILIITIFCLPIGVSNLLWSFQNQFYFMILFSLIAIRLSTACTISFCSFTAITIFCFCASFSSAGGVLTFFVTALVIMQHGFVNKDKLKYWLMALILLSIFFIMLNALFVSINVFSMGKTGNFFNAFMTCILWTQYITPVSIPEYYGFIQHVFNHLLNYTGAYLWIPLFVVIYKYKTGRANKLSELIFPLSIYLWLLLLYVAISQKRIGFNDRYTDIGLINMIAVMFLLDVYQVKVKNISRYFVIFTNGVKLYIIVFLILYAANCSLILLRASRYNHTEALFALKNAVKNNQNRVFARSWQSKYLYNANSELIWQLTDNAMVRNKILKSILFVDK